MKDLGRLFLAAALGFAVVGCKDNSPPTPYVVPPEIGRDSYRRDVTYPKPLPPQNQGERTQPANPAR